ncbi:MAG: alpha-amylase family glycosyl hydrolase [Bacteroidales bacterium]|jgi:hypothetical protein|nr:alpha-amylase family glycosyl hydrolase [Bacteroidales bacterium]
MQPWKKNPVIYEINTWVWLGELGLRFDLPITLYNVPAMVWDELALLKVDAVWLMGVWERSPRGIDISNQNTGNLTDFRRALPDFTLSDNVGSPYCVRRYVADQQLGGPEGLALARKNLADRGIKLILDFVPNHVAHDHPWVEEFPDYFIRGSENDLHNDPVTFVQIGTNFFACGKDPYFPAWQDVLQVNAFNPGLREEAIETVTRIASQCDGIRCDMAMLMLNRIVKQTWGIRAGSVPETDYWEDLIPAVKRTNNDFIFIAESYWDLEWELMQQGFDYCYDKRLYDRLENGDPESIRLHLTAGIDYQSKLARFIENHDEPRAAAIFSLEQEYATAIAVATLPGLKIFNEGQFEGRKIKLPVFLRRRPLETADTGMQEFYSKLLGNIHRQCFRDGHWQLFESFGWPENINYKNLLAWGWSFEDELYLIVINLSRSLSQGRIKITWPTLTGHSWRLTDPLSGQSYDRDGDEMANSGLYVSLKPRGYHFFQFTQFFFPSR